MTKRPSNVWPALTHEISAEMQAFLPTEMVDLLRKIGVQVRATPEELAQEYNLPVGRIHGRFQAGIETVGEAIRCTHLAYRDAIMCVTPHVVTEGAFSIETGDARTIVDAYLAFHEGRTRPHWDAEFTAGVDVAMRIEEPRLNADLAQLRMVFAPVKEHGPQLSVEARVALKAARDKLLSQFRLQ